MMARKTYYEIPVYGLTSGGLRTRRQQRQFNEGFRITLCGAEVRKWWAPIEEGQDYLLTITSVPKKGEPWWPVLYHSGNYINCGFIDSVTTVEMDIWLRARFGDDVQLWVKLEKDDA